MIYPGNYKRRCKAVFGRRSSIAWALADWGAWYDANETPEEMTIPDEFNATLSLGECIDTGEANAGFNIDGYARLASLDG